MNENWFEKIEDYIKGAMSREEQLLFESELAKNEELYAEFRIYQEIETEMLIREKHGAHKDLLRKSLEKLNEKYFGNESEMEADKEKKEYTPGIYIKKDHIFKEGYNKGRINRWKWLAAAVFTGFAFLGVAWWYKEQNVLRGNIIKKEPGSQVVTNKKMDRPGNVSFPDTSSLQVKAPSSETISSNIPVQNRNIEKLKREKLFAINFEPDHLPADIDAPLEDPSAFYKSQKHEKAILEYKNLLADIEDAKNSDLAARGEDNKIELITFYAHHYLAQSYMSVNNMTNAIQHLEIAIKSAPDTIWRNKAKWYLALAYIKTGKIQRAETLLNEVAYKANEYKQKAIKLLVELKEK